MTCCYVPNLFRLIVKGSLQQRRAVLVKTLTRDVNKASMTPLEHWYRMVLCQMMTSSCRGCDSTHEAPSFVFVFVFDVKMLTLFESDNSANVPKMGHEGSPISIPELLYVLWLFSYKASLCPPSDAL